ncbi:IclR family transcriptional regulator [Bradyrhizobium arachidis]|uniref:IclR family transcriptional regulator n=1 Tax=Bradyrhizobium arachidis TaxID=858423 RepID=UPI0021612DA6|nr:IclR family transcriptional regulator [Bradyrhizobium arachidis]UVO30468.1 IclR family transcriptional regulator [Bradyrhizobium arachidis]
MQKNSKPSPKRTPKSAAKARVHREKGADSSLFVNSIQKAVSVLNAFSRERPRLTLAAITRLTGLDKSAAQRFLYTLHQLGLVRKDDETKQYSLSPRLLEFAYAYTYSDGLIERAQPFLVEAHEKTRETVNLMVLDGTDIILVSRIPGEHVVTMNIQVGFRMPALYSATGRAIVSRLDPKQRDQVIRTTKYHQYTDRSVSDPSEMRKLLEKAASEGFVLTQSQYFYGDISIAAAVIDGSKTVLGAVSLSVPESRMTVQEAREKLVPVTIEAARKVSLSMGAY